MTESRLLDLRGVACPMNFVKTKLLLDKMASGERLEVWLDDGEPVESVSQSVQQEGHALLESTRTADGYYRVLIEKSLG